MTGKLVVGTGSATATGAGSGAAEHMAPLTVGQVSHATVVPTQKQGNQELTPTLEGGTKIFNLTARAVKLEVLPGVFEEAWTYNGQLPGPILRVVEGAPMVKDTINIAPGERYDLEFVADNPGTWVFHCHILSHVANRGVEPGGMITVIKIAWSRTSIHLYARTCAAPAGPLPAQRRFWRCAVRRHAGRLQR